MRLLLASLVLSISVVVAPTERFTKRVCFLVDRSGSMEGHRFDKAVEAWQAIAAQPTDDMEITIIAFADAAEQWPEGWVKLPDAEALKRAHQWLYQEPIGSTWVTPGIWKALDQGKDLTVVLITDGGFYMENDATILAALTGAQEKRKKDGLKPATVAVVSVADVRSSLFTKIGKDHRGGFYRMD